MIPQETVGQILDAARIEEVVGDFVTLKRRGANFVACCPFHNEKTPSFYVSPSKGIYKCFGCGKAGSAVGFVMEQEHCEYPDALRYLARKYHIEIVEAEENAEEIMERQRRESLLLVSEFAQKFYARQLESGEGQAVGLAYFRRRGLEDETIAKFGLGWAPSGRTSFIDAALSAGYKMEYILGAGLAVQQEGGNVVDKFRERVMFPIHSVSGRVLAFSGRTLRSDNPAKYVNSPETEIYVKSRNLLGIYFAKSEISRLHKCILVEGNVDMVTMHQLGIRNVVASCGTSLTVEQIRLIKKFTDDVTIMYDGDSAGIHAALRGIDLVLAEGLNVKIVLLPEGEDPDSFARAHNLEEVNAFIERNEKDFIEFKADLLLRDAAGDPLKKANLINDVTDSIAGIPDPVKRSVYVDICATRFGVEPDILFDRITSGRNKMNQGPERQSVEIVRSQPLVIEENPILGTAEREILSLLLNYGDEPLCFPTDSEYYTPDPESVSGFIRACIGDTGFVNSLYRKLYELYMERVDEGMTLERLLPALYDSEDRALAELAVELSTRKYILSVDNFAKSMTAQSSWLTVSVPKAIVFYAERRVQSQLDDARRRLSCASPEEQESIMAEMIKLNSRHSKLKEKLGRSK